MVVGVSSNHVVGSRRIMIVFLLFQLFVWGNSCMGSHMICLNKSKTTIDHQHENEGHCHFDLDTHHHYLLLLQQQDDDAYVLRNHDSSYTASFAFVGRVVGVPIKSMSCCCCPTIVPKSPFKFPWISRKMQGSDQD